ncbi:hypothetical protein SRHO_G00136880 [Serrasalmus rhombeus]
MQRHPKQARAVSEGPLLALNLSAPGNIPGLKDGAELSHRSFLITITITAMLLRFGDWSTSAFFIWSAL